MDIVLFNLATPLLFLVIGVIGYFLRRIHLKVEESASMRQVTRMIADHNRLQELELAHLTERLNRLEVDVKDDLKTIEMKLDKLSELILDLKNRGE